MLFISNLYLIENRNELNGSISIRRELKKIITLISGKF